MPFNGSGVFVRLYSWTNDALAGIKIRADRMDNETNGISTALSTCITKDGQTTITADLPMAGFKHTGVGDAAARTQYSSLGQVQDGKSNWVDGGGTADAITAIYSPAIATLVDGQLCFVRATAANATTTPTFSPSGLTARTIVKKGNQALAAGDIAADGHELILRYRLSDTKWELLNPAGVASTPSFTQVDFISGIIEVPVNADYMIVVKAPYGGTISNTITKCVSGTATFTFKINSTPLGGTANAVSSAEVDQAQASANVFAAGDDLVITISANSSCYLASFTIKFNRTLA